MSWLPSLQLIITAFCIHLQPYVTHKNASLILLKLLILSRCTCIKSLLVFAWVSIFLVCFFVFFRWFSCIWSSKTIKEFKNTYLASWCRYITVQLILLCLYGRSGVTLMTFAIILVFWFLLREIKFIGLWKKNRERKEIDNRMIFTAFNALIENIIRVSSWLYFSSILTLPMKALIDRVPSIPWQCIPCFFPDALITEMAIRGYTQ